MNVFDYLPADSPVEDYIVIMAALTAMVNAYLVYRVMLVRDPLGPRIKAMKQRRDVLRADLSAPRRRAQRDRSIGLMKEVVDRLNLLRTREAKKASDRLLQAGFRSPDAITIYFFLKLALPFAFGAIALFSVYVFKLVEVEGVLRMVVCLGAVVVGAYGPEVYLKNVITKRKAKLRKGLPDALDLLVICAEAGQSLDGALTRVSRELGRSFSGYCRGARPDRDRARPVAGTASGARKPEPPDRSSRYPRCGEYASADREIRNAARPVAARAFGGVS